MSEFVVKLSYSGHANAVHKPSGVSVHSAVDPLREAHCVAELLARQHGSVLLVGNGLGYLANELKKREALSACVEVFGTLATLCKVHGVFRDQLLCETRDSMTRVFSTFLPGSRLIVMPYVRTLAPFLDTGLRECLNTAHVRAVSREVYDPIVSKNISENERLITSVKQLDFAEFCSPRIPVAVGSSPSLSVSIECLREFRSELTIVAASGAIPVLRQFGLNADFIVAMEARSTVLVDLEFANGSEWTIVFPWTHPQVLRNLKLPLLMVSQDQNIFTQGGASGLAAADIASRLGPAPIYLIGMDMSDSFGEYSKGVARTSANFSLSAPKFDFMRNSARAWAQNSGKQFKHVVMPGTERIHGFDQIYPVELRTAFERDICERELLSHCHD